MAGERLIQVIDIGRFRAIRPALDELDAARALSLESHAVLQEAAASPFAHSKSRLGFAMLVGRILRHPELELRVFFSPRELDRVIEGVMHVRCFENGAESSMVTPVGPSWVVLDRALAVFGDLDWFRTIFDPNPEERQLPYPRVGLEGRYRALQRLKSGGPRTCGCGAPAPVGRSDPHRDRHPAGDARRPAPRATRARRGATPEHCVAYPRGPCSH